MYFAAGVEDFRAKRWSDVITRMEKALTRYLDDEERCRFACEKPFDMGWYPDFVSAVASKLYIP
jgi:hypothetical protein